MKKFKQKTLLILSLMFTILMINSISCFATTTGSFLISTSKSTLEIGETSTLTITVTNCEGRFDIISSNPSVVSVSKYSEFIGDAGSSGEITLTALAEGTVTITVVAVDVSDNQEQPEDVEGSKTKTITVNAAQTPVEPDPVEPDPVEPTVEPSQPTEPTFTSTNKTMYSTGAINLRASWSTSSNATKIDKDTELTVTGTSTDKVNGYIWYRVSYNGSTKYVSSSLLTETKPAEEEKNNANLKSLTVDDNELVPTFNVNTTSYSMNVNNDVTELNIKAVAEDDKATVDIKGNKDLKEGENVIAVSVSAEDGTIKIYEIKVTRLEKTELGLKTLKIKDTNIKDKFKTEVYDYEIDIKDVDTLEIETVATDEKATVEILGNKDLKEGENLITIIVKSEDGKETVTYQIKANKKLEENNNTTTATTKSNDNFKLYLYGGIALVSAIVLAIVITFIIKNRNKDEFYEDDDDEKFEGFPEELPERPYDFEPRYKPYKRENNDEENIEDDDNTEESDVQDNHHIINPFMKQYEEKINAMKNEIENANEQQEENEENDNQDNELDFNQENNEEDYYYNDDDDNEKTNNKKGKHF